MTVDKEELKTIEMNYKKFLTLATVIQDDDNRIRVRDLLKEVEARLAVAPASTQTRFFGAYPGGLVDSSLQVAKYMNQMNKELFEGEVDQDDVVLTGLLFQLGKLGDEVHHYYLRKDSDWHNQRGIMFEVNNHLEKDCSWNVRSLYWINKYGIRLSAAALDAILAAGRLGDPVSQEEVFETSQIRLLLEFGYRAVTKKFSGKESVNE